MERSVSGCVCALLSLAGALAAAQEPLTLAGALQRAREQGVTIVAGRWRIEEARARAQGARVPAANPVLESALGDRERASSRDFEVGLSQTFSLAGRGARIAAAEAGLDQETARVESDRTRLLREVALGFLRALAANERVDLARAAEEQAAEVERIARRRFAAQDVAELDVNLAAASAGRARAETRTSQASAALAVGALRALLAYEPDAPLALAGDLRPFLPDPDASSVTALPRADVRAAEAELRQAEAEAEAAKARRWPDLTPSVRVERDQGDRVWWGGLSVSVPAWNRGQEARGVAEARASRLRAAADALRRVARQEALSAREAYGWRLAALAEMDGAASRLQDNETLSRRSYEEGQIGLAELLLVRRETVDARVAHLERRLDASEAEIEWMVQAGVLR